MAFVSISRPKPNRIRRKEDGYVLLVLLLVVSLMGIAMLAVIIPIKFEIQREQETEMIHRGVQYTRAIRGYYKKWGRYPTRLEDLENTNNLRYLRKRYKDPLNKNKDFRLLHYGEQGVTLGGAIGGGPINGAVPAGSAGLGGSPSSAFGGPGNGSAFGSSGPGNSGFGSSGANPSGVFSQSSGLGGNSSTGFGSNSNSQTSSSQPGTNPPSGSDPPRAPDNREMRVPADNNRSPPGPSWASPVSIKVRPSASLIRRRSTTSGSLSTILPPIKAA